MNIIYLFITLFSLVTFNIAQLSIDSSPQSIINNLNQNVPIFTTSKLDIQGISYEDMLRYLDKNFSTGPELSAEIKKVISAKRGKKNG